MVNLKSKISYLVAIIIMVATFFSCGNDVKEVQDFLADKNLPIGVAENVKNIHTDSGRVDSKLITPLLYDFSNRKEHPYTEFPKGIRITSINKKGDSITIKGDYSITFTKTNISEIKGNVEVVNYENGSKLTTEQVFWDQNLHYFFTEKEFTFLTRNDTLKGVGFESKEDLTKWLVKNLNGNINIKDIN